MSTLKKGVIENGNDLKMEMKKHGLDPENITVIGFSRGCLVAKEVFSDQNKILFAAGTLKGTPLASKENIIKLLDRVTTLSAKAEPTGSVVGGAFKLARFISSRILSFPGIQDQAPKSALLIKQAQFIYNNKMQSFIAANYAPSNKIIAILDFGIDQAVFRGTPNDGVTLSLGALNLKPGESQSNANNLFIENKEISHFSIFNDDNAYLTVVNFL
jgi:hypothetical protein